MFLVVSLQWGGRTRTPLAGSLNHSAYPYVIIIIIIIIQVKIMKFLLFVIS